MKVSEILLNNAKKLKQPVEQDVSQILDNILSGSIELTEDQIRQLEINKLKKQIESTDYRIIKCYEYQLVNKSLPYDIEVLHQEREGIRQQINSLEETE